MEDPEANNPFTAAILAEMPLFVGSFHHFKRQVFIPSNSSLPKVYRHFGVSSFEELFPNGIPEEYIRAITVSREKMPSVKTGLKHDGVLVLDGFTDRDHATRVNFVKGFVSTEEANQAIFDAMQM